MRPWLALLTVVATLGVTPLFFQRIVESVLFQPSPGVDFTPEELGIAAEELRLQAEDGVRLHAFFLQGPPDSSRAILFLHGNAGNASHRLPNAAELVRLGIHVLLPDYRGFGLSEGTPSEAGVYADARAALAYLVEERQIRLARHESGETLRLDSGGRTVVGHKIEPHQTSQCTGECGAQSRSVGQEGIDAGTLQSIESSNDRLVRLRRSAVHDLLQAIVRTDHADADSRLGAFAHRGGAEGFKRVQFTALGFGPERLQSEKIVPDE